MKIFVTVGAQMPFDRLVVAVDGWFGLHLAEHEVFAQIGETVYRPPHVEHVGLLEPPEFRQRVLWADVLVAHAGMGSILTALQYGKPILIMPRRGALHETRNDHQVATAERFRTMPGVAVAMDETDIPAQLDGIAKLAAGERIQDHASDKLIVAIQEFIQHAP